MATPSHPSDSEVVYRRQNKGPPFKFLVPLVYAPVLPLIRLSLRKNPVLRDRLFTLVLAGAFVHGSYLVCMDPRAQKVGFEPHLPQDCILIKTEVL
ncbi:hypothetical protein QUC31_020014 [Theobroma cacao]|uniref:Uncharacterized protein LOC18588699 isoform X1 n=1 Tax=Theobroma cacao TaxID=3641 RepID=A0AB32WQC1_THECC|nr:PREDICTED: uncharacterized protein LOC18588699 isoform X1 [Theobroma cacao]